MSRSIIRNKEGLLRLGSLLKDVPQSSTSAQTTSCQYLHTHTLASSVSKLSNTSKCQTTLVREFGLFNLINAPRHKDLIEMINTRDPQTLDYFYSIPKLQRAHNDWVAMILYQCTLGNNGVVLQLLNNYVMTFCHLPRITSPSMGSPLTNDQVLRQQETERKREERLAENPGNTGARLPTAVTNEVLSLMSSVSGFKHSPELATKMLDYFRTHGFKLNEDSYNRVLEGAALAGHFPTIEQVLDFMREDCVSASPKTWRSLIQSHLTKQQRAVSQAEVAEALTNGEYIFQNMQADGNVSPHACTLMVLMSINAGDMERVELYHSLMTTHDSFSYSALLHAYLTLAVHNPQHRATALQLTMEMLRGQVQVRSDALDAHLVYDGIHGDLAALCRDFLFMYRHDPLAAQHILPEAGYATAKRMATSMNVENTLGGLPVDMLSALRKSNDSALLQGFDAKTVDSLPVQLPFASVETLTYMIRSLSSAMHDLATHIRHEGLGVDLDAPRIELRVLLTLLAEANPSLDPAAVLADTHPSLHADVAEWLLLQLASKQLSTAAPLDVDITPHAPTLVTLSQLCVPPALLPSLWLCCHDRVQSLYSYANEAHIVLNNRLIVALMTTFSRAPPRVVTDPDELMELRGLLQRNGQGQMLNDSWQQKKCVELAMAMYSDSYDVDIPLTNTLIRSSHSLQELNTATFVADLLFGLCDVTTFNALIATMNASVGSRSLVYEWFKNNNEGDAAENINKNVEVSPYVNELTNLIMSKINKTVTGTADGTPKPRTNGVAKFRNSRATTTVPDMRSVPANKLFADLLPTSSKFLRTLHNVAVLNTQSYALLLQSIYKARHIDTNDVEIANYALTQIYNLNCADSGDVPGETNVAQVQRLLSVPGFDVVGMYLTLFTHAAPVHSLYQHSLTSSLLAAAKEHNTQDAEADLSLSDPTIIPVSYMLQSLAAHMFLLQKLDANVEYAKARVAYMRLNSQLPVRTDLAATALPQHLKDFALRYRGGPLATEDVALKEELSEELLVLVKRSTFAMGKPDSGSLLHLISPNNTDDPAVEASWTHGMDSNYVTRDNKGLGALGLHKPYIFAPTFFQPQNQKKKADVYAFLLECAYKLKDFEHNFKHSHPGQVCYTPFGFISDLQDKTEDILECLPFVKTSLGDTQVPPVEDTFAQ